MNLILPGTGAYFIRRSFQNDPVYKECLRSFITYLVERRFHQEFFIEGGRTRSGKLLPPRYGMLRYVVDGVRRSEVYDVCFIPTAITYDQILEVDDYARQEQGEAKEQESFGFLVRTIRSLRSRRFGRVYVHFAEPIVLQDHLKQRGDDELTVEKLAFHISNEINAHTRLTAVSAVCSALLSAGRCALTDEELATQLGRMLDFAAERGIPIGRELQAGPKSAMEAGIRALQGGGRVEHYEGGIDPIYWVPESYRHVASYYRNSVVHFFLVRAITALAVHAAEASANTEAEADVETWALRLRELLKFEFFFRDRAEFSDEVSREHASLSQERQAGLTPIGAAGPQVMLDYLESYWVVTESLGAIAHTHNDISEKDFLARCHSIGRQLLLQDRIHAPEPLSSSSFRNALKLATNLGAAETTPTGYRRGDSAALKSLSRDLELLAQLARV